MGGRRGEAREDRGRREGGGEERRARKERGGEWSGAEWRVTLLISLPTYIILLGSQLGRDEHTICSKCDLHEVCL